MASDDRDIESLLRASLTEHAGRVPPGDALAERIIGAVDRPRAEPTPWHRPPAPRRQWLLSAAAVAAVAALATAVVAGGARLHRTTADRPPVPPLLTTSNPAPLSHPSGRPSASAPARTSAAGTPSPAASDSGFLLSNFRAIDLTFIGEQDGFALGAADCIHGSGRCPAIQRTRDGGQTWSSVNVNFDVPATSTNGCAADCVDRLRFADGETGYAFGPAAFYLTLDGGAHWAKQPGGAAALETLNDNVLRITGSADSSGAPRLERAPLGSSTWSPVALPNTLTPRTLARVNRSVFVLAHSPRTGQDALLTSADDGATWADRGDVCRPSGADQGSGLRDLAVGLDGTVLVSCASPAGTVALSTDGGASFRTGIRSPTATAARIGVASSAALFVAADGQLYRSADGGSHWTQVATDATVADPSTDPSAAAGFLGFESGRAGRWIAGDGSTIWTTEDAGLDWSPHSFD